MEKSTDVQADIQGFIDFLQTKLAKGFPEPLTMDTELKRFGFPDGSLKAMLSAKFIIKDDSPMSRKQSTPCYLFGPDTFKLNALQRAEKLMDILPDGKPLAFDSPTKPHEKQSPSEHWKVYNVETGKWAERSFVSLEEATDEAQALAKDSPGEEFMVYLLKVSFKARVEVVVDRVY